MIALTHPSGRVSIGCERQIDISVMSINRDGLVSPGWNGINDDKQWKSSTLTGSNPTKNDHPGTQPEAEGSKKPSANDAGRRPTTAFTDSDMSMASYIEQMEWSESKLGLNN